VDILSYFGHYGCFNSMEGSINMLSRFQIYGKYVNPQ
jgi:hypothetical protein